MYFPEKEWKYILIILKDFMLIDVEYINVDWCWLE